ncbi:hypothetical protein GIB67_042961 [Kingdonia uniflora]|uniref:Retrotransposon Copia-like N-terminal domain-containing protein n=1 Tax=Kingdonia uniflora TaxID=39325 RepID=A0A7J7L5Z7_9MAGN|nr:hypothetical protein GIB67_042961 [Kingdonia uniflora]
MAIGGESSSNVSLIGTSEDAQSFNYVHDNPNLKITSQLLDGLNYVRWAQSVKLFVGGRGKIRFLLGTEKEVAESDPKYAKWFSDDSMVLRLWGCIIRDFDRVGKNYLIMIASSSGQLAHKVKRTPFPTLEEAHAYCLSNQSRRSPMPSIPGIPSETSAMAFRFVYPAPPSVPS